MVKKIKGYQCFSVPQKDFLLNKGLEYLVAAIDQKTHKTFWLFVKCDELQEALDEWRDTNPNRK